MWSAVDDGYWTGQCNLLLFKDNGSFVACKEIPEHLEQEHGLSDQKSSQVL